jgi:hypothetical protein
VPLPIQIFKWWEVRIHYHLDGYRGLHLIIGSDSRVARVGPTTPKRIELRLLRSIQRTRAALKWRDSSEFGRPPIEQGKMPARQGGAVPSAGFALEAPILLMNS